ncbi:MAG: hemerythrin domain-containing protein [Acidobacteria bacterium]|nr:MAG: hemerythrin domain-containing protein [Acidobacteriota bacterium]
MKAIHALTVSVLLCSFAASAGAQSQQRPAAAPAAKAALATPSSIREEHAHLRQDLNEAIGSGGQTAVRARAVAAVLLPHFKAEEAYAMPPLGLLQALAEGQTLSREQRHKAMAMAQQLQAHYPQMLQEHRQIHTRLEALAAVARQEHKPAATAFANSLMLHAQNEEQVLYPATILIGKFLALRQPGGK